MTALLLRRRFPIALILLLAFSLAACDADLQETPESMSLTARGATEVMPAGAIVIGMIDLKSLAANPFTTPFGDAGFFTRHLDGEARARFDDFTSATGLDPETDLTEVYAALEPVGEEERVSFAIYGEFDREALQSYVDNRLGDELTQRAYAGIPVFTSTNDHGGIAFALASDEMVVAASDFDAVAAMIDRLQGQGSSVADNAELMRRIARAASAGDVWGVVNKPSAIPAPSETDEIESQLAQLWTAIDAVGGGLDVQTEALDTRVQFYPSDGVSTDDLASLLRGALAMARAQEGLDDDKRSLLDDAEIDAEADYVSFKLTAPNTFFEGLAQH